MLDRTKIITCSYCGTRAALDLRGKARHELCCTTCGAPIHLMKPMKRAVAERRSERSSERKPDRKGAYKHTGEDRKRAPRRALRLFEKIWDELEDILD